jgi:hypothetical protein
MSLVTSRYDATTGKNRRMDAHDVALRVTTRTG